MKTNRHKNDCFKRIKNDCFKRITINWFLGQNLTLFSSKIMQQSCKVTSSLGVHKLTLILTQTEIKRLLNGTFAGRTIDLIAFIPANIANTISFWETSRLEIHAIQSPIQSDRLGSFSVKLSSVHWDLSWISHGSNYKLLFNNLPSYASFYTRLRLSCH